MTLLICPGCREVGQAGDDDPDAWYICPQCGLHFFAKEARSLPEGTVALGPYPRFLTRESRDDPVEATRHAHEIGPGEGPLPG